MWRVWTSGRATLAEIEEHWSWADLMDALLVLELERRAEMRARQIEEARVRALNRR